MHVDLLRGRVLVDELAPPLFVFGLLWFLNGAGQALIAIPSSTLLAEHTVEEERGRVDARLLAHYVSGLGHAATKWEAPVTFIAAGILCLLITAAAGALGQGVLRSQTHTRDKASAI